ncbi:MAG: amidophosphoribosyltransferase [Clostridiales bacterium]|nr:amidophosphoribosyltransferase [Clostridiales bacterium]
MGMKNFYKDFYSRCDHDRIQDKMHEECGVFGIYSNDSFDVARMTYYGLYALQHRGEESAGIAVNDSGRIIYRKDMGLVPDVFDPVVLNHLKGSSAIGHVRYSTTGASMLENAQPIVVKYKNGQMALAHNGNIVNAHRLRSRMEESGAIFQSTNDTEVIANLISRFRISSENIEETLPKVMEELRGSYALVILTPKRLVGIRDPLGIRPLCIGRLENSYILASESCALDAVGATFMRNVEAGEIVLISADGLTAVQTSNMNYRGVESKTPATQGTKDTRLCIFEFVYLARPDSVIDGASVHKARLEAGRELARQHPADADIVIGAPDGGLIAALGFSRESGIPYAQGLLKNRYVGRTFIQPEQGQRELGVMIKFNAIRSEIEGKKIVMVDDSIVRGTTTRRIVQMLKDAGASEVHMRVSSPPYKFPCHFGIDTPSKKHLVASRYSVEEIKDIIGADSLGYLSLDGLLKAPIGVRCGLCTACFNGEYPMEVPDEANKFAL